MAFVMSECVLTPSVVACSKFVLNEVSFLPK